MTMVMGTLKHMAYSINTGFNAGWNAWTGNTESFLDISNEQAWDDYQPRMQRYSVYDAYYANTVYKTLNQYGAMIKTQNGLYKHIRGIYNPVARYVEVMTGFVYGGAIDMETLRGGSIPIVGGDDALVDAIRQLFMWSNMNSRKALYVRNGGRYGDAVLKIVDDRAREKVYIEVIEPKKIAYVDKNAQGDVKEIVIEYERVDKDDPRQQPYRYTETIDKDAFRTYKNGQPYAFYSDKNGNPVVGWDNEYGFVPVAIAGWKDLGYVWNAPGFSGAPLDKINEVNDVASMLNDNIRNAVQAIWAAKGTKKSDTRESEVTKRDQFTLLHVAKDADFQQLHTQIPIADTLQAIAEMLRELTNDLPELSLASIRATDTNLTAPGVRAGFGDAIKRVQDTRSNFDTALVKAIQMAVAIGGLGGYENMESFDLDSYARGDLDFYIGTRPVIEDSLSKVERLGAIQSLSGDDRDIFVMKELDFSEDDIAKYEQASALKAQMETEALIRSQEMERGSQLSDEESVALVNSFRNGG